MKGSNKLDYHFIDLKGDITGGDQQPVPVAEHRSLSLNQSSVHSLIATRSSDNTGAPLAATTPSPTATELVREEPPVQISGFALGVDYSLPTPPQVDPVESDATPQPEEAALPEPAAVLEEEQPDEAGQEVRLTTLDAVQELLEDPLTEPLEVLETAEEIELGALPVREVEAEPAPPALPTVTANVDTDHVLSDVQNTLDSLADMAKNLTQQKLEAVKQQEGLDQRKVQLYEKERLLADKDEQLRLLEARLTRELSNLERNAEDNARALAERSAALKALADNVEARDRSTAKFADTLRQEKQRNDELSESLQRRTEALDEREAALNRKDDELAEKLKQLVATKERFRKLVKSFNETVQFNNTLNAISSTSPDDSPH